MPRDMHWFGEKSSFEQIPGVAVVAVRLGTFEKGGDWWNISKCNTDMVVNKVLPWEKQHAGWVMRGVPFQVHLHHPKNKIIIKPLMVAHGSTTTYTNPSIMRSFPGEEIKHFFNECLEYLGSGRFSHLWHLGLFEHEASRVFFQGLLSAFLSFSKCEGTDVLLQVFGALGFFRILICPMGLACLPIFG